MRTMDDMKSHGEALNQAVGHALRAARRAADMTQEQVIAATGLSKSTINRIEKGSRVINTVDLALITEVIGVEPQAIMRKAQDLAAWDRIVQKLS